MVDHDAEGSQRQGGLPETGPVVRGLRIVVLGIFASLITLGGVAIFIVQFGGGPRLQPQGIITLGLLVVSAMLLTAQFVVPAVLHRVARQRFLQQGLPSLDQLVSLFCRRLVIGIALTEATGIMASVAYLLEGHSATLPVIAVAGLLILLRLPSAEGLAAWMEREAEWLRERQQAG